MLTVVLVAATVSIGPAVSAAALPLPTDAEVNFPPPPPGDGVSFSQFPDCSDVGKHRSMPGFSNLDAGQLGWVGTPSILQESWVTDKAAQQVVPAIPCRTVYEGGAELSVMFFAKRFYGSSDTSYRLKFDVHVKCYSGGVETVTDSDEWTAGGMNMSPYIPVGEVRTATSVDVPGATLSGCPVVTGVYVDVSGNRYPDATPYYAITRWNWMPSAWSSSSGGWVPASSPGELGAGGLELPIVCAVDTSGDDMFAVIGNVVRTFFAGWLPCMVVPRGWDRAGEISAAWTSGAMGQAVAAFKELVPNGIECGPVAEITFHTAVVPLNTCVADVAPGFVKVAVGWVLVLGIALLCVRRIMWSVGSRG